MDKFYNNHMETEIFSKTNIEEEVSNLSQILTSAKSYQWIKNETLVVIIRQDNSSFCDKLSTMDLCGKYMIDWVSLSLSVCEQKIINAADSAKLLQYLKDLKTDKRYIFITYSDIPLLERNTFYKIMDYFSSNNLNAMKFDRGLVYKTEFLQDAIDLDPVVKKYFGGKDFERIEDASDFARAYTFLQNKIKNYHKNNNVVLLGEDTIFIDADVEIESGVIIYPNNILKGQTYIGKNVVLESGNTISDSIISNNCIIEKSVIIKSKVEENKSVKPFTIVENESI